jgi:hypothetical protein
MIVSPDEDIIIKVVGGVYKNSITEQNRYATVSDLSGTSGVQSWTAENDVEYTIRQAHGGVEVQPTASDSLSDEVGGAEVYENAGLIEVFVSLTSGMDQLLTDISDGVYHLRRISIAINGNDFYLRDPVRISADETNARWRFNCDTGVSITESGYALFVEYDGPPEVWWDADDLGFITDSNNYWQFRGAKIEYHAFVTDSATVIGTIYIAHDSGDNHVTHMETSSGGTDAGTALFWHRETGWNNERKLYLYRTDGESVNHTIHWTAQVYYAAEYYDD